MSAPHVARPAASRSGISLRKKSTSADACARSRSKLFTFLSTGWFIVATHPCGSSAIPPTLSGGGRSSRRLKRFCSRRGTSSHIVNTPKVLGCKPCA